MYVNDTELMLVVTTKRLAARQKLGHMWERCQCEQYLGGCSAETMRLAARQKLGHMWKRCQCEQCLGGCSAGDTEACSKAEVRAHVDRRVNK